jgi:hypothetical protein
MSSILKRLPLGALVLFLVSAGLVFASFTYISNIQTQVVEVGWEIELQSNVGGSFSLHPGESTVTTWPYTVHNQQSARGYVVITYSIDVTPSSEEISVESVRIVDGPTLVLQFGYPNIEGGNLRFAYGVDDGAPYDFGASTGGTIEITWTPYTRNVSEMSVRIADVITVYGQ